MRRPDSGSSLKNNNENCSNNYKSNNDISFTSYCSGKTYIIDYPFPKVERLVENNCVT